MVSPEKSVFTFDINCRKYFIGKNSDSEERGNSKHVSYYRRNAEMIRTKKRITYQNPVQREKKLQSVKNRLLNSCAKEQNMRKAKERLENPEKRRTNLFNVEKRLENPEVRQRNHANVKQRRQIPKSAKEI